MNLNSLKNKTICILGLGIENYALVKFLIANLKRIKSELNELDITVCDRRSKKELGDRHRELNKLAKFGARHSIGRRTLLIRWKLGKNYDKELEKFDIIFRSPGYPLHKIDIRHSTFENHLSSPMKLFFELCPTKNIIGVTGTKGKGTTSALICEILKKAGKRVWLGGNIGVAPFEFINKIKKNDWVVLELSSFQLEDMKVSPKIAVITNFYKEHLAPADPNNPNYHRSLKEYWNAKMNIVKWQKNENYAVINSKLKTQNSKLQLKTQNLKSKIIFFTKSDLPTKLVGEHNKENIAAAVEVAKLVGVKKSTIEKTVKNFKGLKHRIEYVKKIGGVKYYNDTFATTPESAITALNSFDAPIILIAGGAEKKSDFKKLAKVIKRKTKCVILLNGKATPRLKKEILKAGFRGASQSSRWGGRDCDETMAGFLGKNMKLVYNMKEAVKIAKQQAVTGDIILLSPACASFGMFKNYKERGELFKFEVGNTKT